MTGGYWKATALMPGIQLSIVPWGQLEYDRQTELLVCAALRHITATIVTGCADCRSRLRECIRSEWEELALAAEAGGVLCTPLWWAEPTDSRAFEVCAVQPHYTLLIYVV